MAAPLILIFFVFNISFLPKYRVKCYDYYCKVVECDIMQLVCTAGYFLNVSFKAYTAIIMFYRSIIIGIGEGCTQSSGGPQQPVRVGGTVHTSSWL